MQGSIQHSVQRAVRSATALDFSRRSFLAASAGLIAAPAFATVGGGDSLPIVRTTSGDVAGVVEGGAYSFKGIPYGEPTGGGARFLPAKPRKPWSDVFDASRFGQRCPQRGGLGGPEAPAFGEDCLVANVWTTSFEGERPVMVWLHGGGWEVGGGDDPVTNGAWLARHQDVVVVSINHRLNVFGHLNLADIADERYAYSANVGVLDIALALAWVRENISRFGGDPDRVLIFGQSGGGRKVSTMMALPAGAGLFHRGVIQSGPGLTMDAPEIGRDRAERLLRKLGIARKDVLKLAQVPTRALTAAGIEVRNETGQFRPSVDGASLPQNPFLPHAPLLTADVPLMVGTAIDEIAAFLGHVPAYGDLSDADMLSQSLRFFPEGQAQPAIDTWRGMYPDFPNGKLFSRLTTDRSYFYDSTLLAQSKAALGRAPAYLYMIDWLTDVGVLKGVSPHGMELAFVFGNLSAHSGIQAVTPEAEALRSAMSGAWAAFARNGTPDHAGMPQWLPYETSLRSTMLFGNTVRLEADPYKQQRKFMDRFGSEQLGAYEPRPPGPWVRD